MRLRLRSSWTESSARAGALTVLTRASAAARDPPSRCGRRRRRGGSARGHGRASARTPGARRSPWRSIRMPLARSISARRSSADSSWSTLTCRRSRLLVAAQRDLDRALHGLAARRLDPGGDAALRRAGDELDVAVARLGDHRPGGVLDASRRSARARARRPGGRRRSPGRGPRSRSARPPPRPTRRTARPRGRAARARRRAVQRVLVLVGDQHPQMPASPSGRHRGPAVDMCRGRAQQPARPRPRAPAPRRAHAEAGCVRVGVESIDDRSGESRRRGGRSSIPRARGAGPHARRRIGGC